MRTLGKVMIGVGVLVLAYPLMSLAIYDYASPMYLEEDSREMDSQMVDGRRHWLEVERRRFAIYYAGPALDWLIATIGDDGYEFYDRIESVFRPLVWLVRPMRGDALLVEWRAERWEGDDNVVGTVTVLEP